MILREWRMAAALVGALAFAAKGAVAEPIEARCLIKPDSVVNIASAVEGLLQFVHVERNQSVKAGDVLAELNSDLEATSVRLARARAESNARIRSASAQVKFQKERLGRAQKLANRKVMANATLDEIRTEAQLAELALIEARLGQRIAELELEQAAELLKRRKIVSPIDGVVVDRLMEPGEYVHEQAILMVVAKLDPLMVEAFLPVDRYGAIAEGMAAEVRPEAPVGGVHAAEVATVDRVFDAASGTFTVRLKLPNADFRVPAGHKCTVSFSPPPG